MSELDDPGLYLYQKVRLVPSISDQEIEEMLQSMSPVVFRDDPEQGEGLYVVDVREINRRTVAYTWDPPILRKARLAWGNGMDTTILTFHKYGAPSLFKPSLSEALACIRTFVPEGWESVKFFWIDSRNMDSSNCLGCGYHFARCHLFASEFPEGSFRHG